MTDHSDDPDSHDHSSDHHGHSDAHDDHAHDDHDHHAHDLDHLGVAVVTVSSSRSMDEDATGDRLVSTLEEAGHDVSVRELIPDDFDRVQGTVDRLVERGDVDAVITSGGTGATPDDVTPEAVRPLFEKALPGFGETFRRLSFAEIGTKTIGSRATAGIADGIPVFCLPGSTGAVVLGLEDVILPEVGHLAGLARRDADEGEVNEGKGDAEEGDAEEDAEANGN
ncbi:molybdenum cofactor biosynthesis protein B [Halopenitus malekzadehii]|uniref:Molybdenum cofactor biosynthesis protein B n=1 Tax=Halopenitus malekzadehii TaxID=1267564 RepID=A0A1H6JYY0_9EURY|nr:MogA/MoaB family molybdenum cofactor biosynthesis protein [Halopenitus malekzadehii]SEH65223.1 molybdenum cofactor biosynthesis protein B [Halopenitus malekzadehii]